MRPDEREWLKEGGPGVVDDTYPLPERRNGDPGRREADRALESDKQEQAIWLMLEDLTGEKDHQTIRDIIRTWVTFYQAASRSKAAAIGWLWTFALGGTAGIIAWWVQEKAPSVAAALRKIGLMP
jgi:hypothetical protein